MCVQVYFMCVYVFVWMCMKWEVVPDKADPSTGCSLIPEDPGTDYAAIRSHQSLQFLEREGGKHNYS